MAPSSYSPLPTSANSSPSLPFSQPSPYARSPSSSTLPSFLQATTARPFRLLVCGCAFLFSAGLLSGWTGVGPVAGVRELGSYAVGGIGRLTFLGGTTVGARRDSRERPRNDELVEPTFVLDETTGLSYPPDVYPAALNIYKRANAVIVSLVRNSELGAMRESMRDVENKFNRKFGYPWIFMNDVEFTAEFKEGVRAETRSEVTFSVVPKEHWSYPSWVNQTLAAEGRQKMVDKDIIYGGSESYRAMCRYNSGFFYKQQVLEPFDFYWRVEPGIQLFCDVDYDPFLFMQANNKKYSFTIAMYEYEATIETLWPTVREFAKLHPEHIADKNALAFLVNDVSQGLDGAYNLCHFWSNFEIADLRFFRSKAYQDFFDYLDATGGFFYERWGDAPVHSIAAALFLPADQLHQFDDIGYRHNPYTHCPSNPKYKASGKCACDPKESFDNDGYSCMRQWWRIGGKPQ